MFVSSTMPYTRRQVAELVIAICEKQLVKAAYTTRQDRRLTSIWPSYAKDPNIRKSGIKPTWSLRTYFQYLRRLSGALDALLREDNDLGELDEHGQIVLNYALRFLVYRPIAHLDEDMGPKSLVSTRIILAITNDPERQRDYEASYTYAQFRRAAKHVVDGPDLDTTQAQSLMLAMGDSTEPAPPPRRVDGDTAYYNAIKHQLVGTMRASGMLRDGPSPPPTPPPSSLPGLGLESRPIRRAGTRKKRVLHATELRARLLEESPGPELEDQDVESERKPPLSSIGKPRPLPKIPERKPLPTVGLPVARKLVARDLESIEQRKQRLERERERLEQELERLLLRLRHDLDNSVMNERQAARQVLQFNALLRQCGNLTEVEALLSAKQDEEEWGTKLGWATTIVALIDACSQVAEIATHSGAIHGHNLDGVKIDSAIFVTNSNWAAIPGLTAAIYEAVVLIRGWHKMDDLEKTIGVVQLGLKGTLQVSQGISTTSWIGTHLDVSLVSSGTAKMANVVGGFANIGLGVLQVGLATKTLMDLDTVGKRWEALLRGSKDRIQADRDLKYLPFKLLGKRLMNKKYRAGVDIVGGLAGIASGGTAIAVTVGISGAAAVAVPVVGWAAAGIGLLVGVGLLSYKGMRKRYKKKLLKTKLGDGRLDSDPPPFVKTTGDYYRFVVAATLFAWASGYYSDRRNRFVDARFVACWDCATVLLGTNILQKLHEDIQDKGVAGMMLFLKS